MSCCVEEPRMNHIDLKITYACNYRCEYCYQANRETGKRYSADSLSKENAENFVEFVKRVGENFQITLAGGEPFVYPYLQYLGENLTILGNTVNLITNFSAPIEKICKFIDGCNNKLGWFSISVHLSQWENMEDFYTKLRQLLEYKEKNEKTFSLVLTCVVTKENFDKVKGMDKNITERFPEIQINYQRVKYDGVYDIYSEEIEEFLVKKGVTVSKEEANHIDFYGRECWAGVRFFYIESNGDIRRCYTRQKNDAVFKLGNLSDLDNVKIFREPYPCLSDKNGVCICHPHFVNEKFVTPQMASEQEIEKWTEQK